jgi:glycosyltransferase involved in cell wall biosynthesis
MIAIGRMTKQKDYSFLINNFKKLSLKYDDIKLLIIGDGEEKKYLQNLITELDILDKVKLINYESNIYKYLKKSKYYISTSIWEGSSLAMIDAAFIGIPILCSDCPTGRKEFIGKNERGFLYKQNDSVDFLNAFANMYSSSPSDIQNLIISAKKRTKKFTPFKSFLKLSEILN